MDAPNCEFTIDQVQHAYECSARLDRRGGSRILRIEIPDPNGVRYAVLALEHDRSNVVEVRGVTRNGVSHVEQGACSLRVDMMFCVFTYEGHAISFKQTFRRAP